MFKWYDLSLNAMIILYDLGLSGFIKSYDLSFNGMIKLYNQIVYQDHAARFVQYDLVLYCKISFCCPQLGKSLGR